MFPELWNFSEKDCHGRDKRQSSTPKMDMHNFSYGQSEIYSVSRPTCSQYYTGVEKNVCIHLIISLTV